MANVVCNLEEHLSDFRSSEIAYRFTAENRGPKTIRLQSLTPQVADGVTLLEVRDTFEHAVMLEQRTLWDDLTTTLRAHLLRLERNKIEMSPIFRVLVPPPETGQRTIDFKIAKSMDAEIALAKRFAELRS